MNFSRTFSITQIKNSSSLISDGLKSSSSSLPIEGDCNPINFEIFFPRLCAFWNTRDVFVIRKDYDEYITSGQNLKTGGKEHENKKSSKPYPTHSTLSDLTGIQFTAYYNKRHDLMALSVIHGAMKLCPGVMKALNVCMSYHPYLTKVCINGGPLDDIIPHIITSFYECHLTDLYLNFCYVSKENYYTLLDHAKLKCLALRRCKINDSVCEQIAKRLSYQMPGGKSLQILDLTGNQIGDPGAKYLGDMLRLNRHLLHLNLAGNRITDDGVVHLLQHLKPFPMNKFELIKCKEKRDEEKIVSFDLSKEELSFRSINSVKSKPRSPKKTKLSLVSISTDYKSNSKIDTIAKDPDDPFAPGTTDVIDSHVHCMGNLKLCSLNLSYNNLTIYSLRYIDSVIKIQMELMKPLNWTGLMRLSVDGNRLPSLCDELISITSNLNKIRNVNSFKEIRKVSQRRHKKEGKKSVSSVIKT